MPDSSSTTPNNGLNKRATFLARIKEATEQVNGAQTFAVLFLNLDSFRAINYGFSYEAGDQLILEVLARLQTLVQPGDMVAHLQADEFGIVLQQGERVMELAQVIQEALFRPFNLKGQEVFTSAAIGIAYGEAGLATPPEDLLRNASLAMHHAKAFGRGSLLQFDQEMRVDAVQRFDLECELQRAVERNEFQIYYQPIVALGSGDFKGFEALVRWQHPRHGFSYASEFMSVAEETGLIVPIGDWVLHQACHQTEEWQEQFGTKLPIAVNVNLSSKQFSNPELVELVEHALNRTNLDAASLRLEVTESVLMENPALSVTQLARLKILGVQLYLDDFGTGHSSLSWLNHFNVDVIKVSQNFLSRMTGSTKAAEIVKAIVELGHNLGMTVVAKGVETDEQLEQIKEMKFDYIQGYLLSEPLDPQNAAEWIDEFISVLEAQNSQLEEQQQ